MQRARKVLWWLLAGFLIYAIVKSPAQAADMVRTGFDIIAQGFQSIIKFFDALLRRG